MSAVEQVLETIPGYSAAMVNRQLSDGPTNSSYLLSLAGESLVLRVDKPGARELGLDRENEKIVLDALADAGLAPAPLYCRPGDGVLLRPFTPGRPCTPQDLESKSRLSELSRLLRSLHAVEPVGKSYDPLGAARRYANQLGSKGAKDLLQRAGELAGELDRGTQTPALCHNDLVCQNIIEGDGFFLIDWEYASVGDPFFDLAIVLQHHGLDDELSGHFLQSYLDRSPSTDEWRRLELQREFYQCLLDLWHQRVGTF